MSKRKVWYSEWFNSKYYHLLYQNRNYSEAESFISNLVDYLKPNSEDHILDLACGKGRHSLYLNQLGNKVTGLDLSCNSIDHARKNENDRLKFDVHDMRNVYQANAYQYIFNLFTSFGYFNSNSQNLKVIQAIKEQLVDQGIVVIDYFNATKVAEQLVENESKTVDGIEFNIKKWIDGRNVFKSIAFRADGSSFQYTERVELLNLSDFKNYLDATGLQLFTTFGSYSLEEFHPLTSDRLILLAKKEK